MLFGFITMCVAGSVEARRQHDCPGTRILDNRINWSVTSLNRLDMSQHSSTMSHSTLSIYSQVPQHMSLGIAQIFSLLASFEFAYFIAPRSARSLFMSFHSISRILADYIVEAYMVNFQFYFSVSVKIK